MKLGNAGRGKEPDFWRVTGRDQECGDWLCLSTPSRTRRSRKELYLPAKMAMFSESRPRLNKTFVYWYVKPVGKPDAGNSHVRFDEGECGNGARLKYCDSRRRKGESTGNTNLSLNHRATSLLYRGDLVSFPGIPNESGVCSLLSRVRLGLLAKVADQVHKYLRAEWFCWPVMVS